ncbi:MAG: hypothetical protein V7K24_09975 [Nostoc sp.]
MNLGSQKLRTSEAGCGESRTPRFNREERGIIPAFDSNQCSVKKVKLMRRSTGLITTAFIAARVATLSARFVTEFPAYREVL